MIKVNANTLEFLSIPILIAYILVFGHANFERILIVFSQLLKFKSFELSITIFETSRSQEII